MLVLVQGSGCGPLFTPSPDGSLHATAGQDIVNKLAAGRLAVLVVEKPGVVSESTPSGDPGTACDCSPEFRRRHALDSWCEVLSAAIDDARRDPRIDSRAPIRLMGLSEGAITVARLARVRRDVSHVAFISGFGCDQWRDVLVVARRDAESKARDSRLDPSAAAGAVRAAIEEAEAGLARVAADPDNSDRFFDDQTHRFWSTFGRACPAQDLAMSSAAVFVAYGTADEQIDPNGVEAIAASCVARGKPILMERVLGGNHVLDTPEKGKFQNLIGVFQRSLDWMSL